MSMFGTFCCFVDSLKMQRTSPTRTHNAIMAALTSVQKEQVKAELSHCLIKMSPFT